jgi:hypothetical protein
VGEACSGVRLGYSNSTLNNWSLSFFACLLGRGCEGASVIRLSSRYGL